MRSWSKQLLVYGAGLVVSVLLIAWILQHGPASHAPAASGVAVEGGGLFSALQANLSHPLSQLFVQLLVLIAAARLAGAIFVRLGLPAVVGEMTAGILLGPSLLGHVAPQAFAFIFPADSLGALRLLSQIGICLFMFTVGMELKAEHLRHKVQSAVAVSHASIVLPFVLGTALATVLFDSLAGPQASFQAFALFMGISLSITAFPVLARILQERGMTTLRWEPRRSPVRRWTTSRPGASWPSWWPCRARPAWARRRCRCRWRWCLWPSCCWGCGACCRAGWM